MAYDGVHCGLVAKIVAYICVQVFQAYLGHSADGYLREDGLHYLCDCRSVSFLHHLYERTEEIECHGLAGEEIVEEAVLFDGSLFRLPATFCFAYSNAKGVRMRAFLCSRLIKCSPITYTLNNWICP